MVSHGNSVQSFMSVYDPKGKEKDIIGVGFCCLSIAQRPKKSALWELVCLGDATHVGCGTTDIIPQENF